MTACDRLHEAELTYESYFDVWDPWDEILEPEEEYHLEVMQDDWEREYKFWCEESTPLLLDQA